MKAIGMVEYKTVSTGIRAADLIVKTADVELIQFTSSHILYELTYIGTLRIFKISACEYNLRHSTPLLNHCLL